MNWESVCLKKKKVSPMDKLLWDECLFVANHIKHGPLWWWCDTKTRLRVTSGICSSMRTKVSYHYAANTGKCMCITSCLFTIQGDWDKEQQQTKTVTPPMLSCISTRHIFFKQFTGTSFCHHSEWIYVSEWNMKNL